MFIQYHYVVNRTFILLRGKGKCVKILYLLVKTKEMIRAVILFSKLFILLRYLRSQSFRRIET